ncbi:hypothetical protein QR680_008319 [Steinernema hermaphroditum]|uniref:Late embryogenesis abundant protein LEA-2 subgroup domain-containing protein n=1 Tax=Steinernema hermaphroditum TaxID=289476 RepID=A0AA39M7F7_9BILA|nr:hypothetical protein QR680_008319 [Steinernema hermaphroditum]
MTFCLVFFVLAVFLSNFQSQAEEAPSDRVTACDDTKYGKICIEAIVENGKEGFNLVGTFKDKKIFSTHVSTTNPPPLNVPLNEVLKLKLYIYEIALNFPEKKGSFKTKGELYVQLYKKPVAKFRIGQFIIENGKIRFNGKG